MSQNVYAEYEYTATEIWLDGMNMGFDTDGGITEIWLDGADFSNQNGKNAITVYRGEQISIDRSPTRILPSTLATTRLRRAGTRSRSPTARLR